jgi:hypothetical protein
MRRPQADSEKGSTAVRRLAISRTGKPSEQANDCVLGDIGADIEHRTGLHDVPRRLNGVGETPA